MTDPKDFFSDTFPEPTLTRAPKNNTTVSPPDWLLYVVPSIAFVLGLLLFSLVYRTQRRREEVFRRVAALKNIMKTSAGHAYTSSQGHTGVEIKDWMKLQNSSETREDLTKQKAQSYENVPALSYSNEEKVSRHDEDYISPDADMTETHKSIYLQPLQNLTDTDGESYENMEGCVYAHPRQPTLKIAHSTEDDDYIDPDGENKPNLEQTDTESYENMDSLACHTTDNTHTRDEDWYECMNRRQI